MSKLIRTTLRPQDQIVVSDDEYLELLTYGLVYGVAAPAPPDPDDVEVAGFLDNVTSQTYARLLAQLAANVAGGTGVLPDALRAAFDAGSKPWLQAVAGAFGFSFTSITTVDSATGLPTAAGVQWPDGTTGTFTGTTDGSNGYTGYTVTWAGGTTKTVTASGITYDSTTGLALGPTTLTVA